ncbi:hypothetical protein [Campylobacter jejuni]|nr:hypothetical protein [Campylobacter jejuni]
MQARNDLGIIPGCAVTPQGTWVKYENGIDVGTCVNSLASIVPCYF